VSRLHLELQDDYQISTTTTTATAITPQTIVTSPACRSLNLRILSPSVPHRQNGNPIRQRRHATAAKKSLHCSFEGIIVGGVVWCFVMDVQVNGYRYLRYRCNRISLVLMEAAVALWVQVVASWMVIECVRIVLGI
jgi:hypothetical protein